MNPRLRLDARHLRLVRTIANEGTLTGAGTKLFLTQSAVSRQLLDLEDKLGGPLFLRVGKRMIPTPAGHKLINRATDVLEQLMRTQEEVQRLTGGMEGCIRLSTECYTCYHWVPHVFAEYRKRFPAVGLEIVSSATRHPVEALFRGELDVAIVSTDPQDPRVILQPLFADEMVAVMHPDHPLASRDYLDAEDFATQHLLMYVLSREESTLFQEVLIPAGVEPLRVTTIDLTEALVSMVKANLGIAVLAEWAVAPDVASGSLKTVRVTSAGIHRQWSVATLVQDEMPLHIRTFAQLLSAGPSKLIPSIPPVTKARQA